MEGLLDDMENAGVSHGCFGDLRFGMGRGFIAFCGFVDVGHVRRRGPVEVPAGKGTGELGDDDGEVANKAEGGSSWTARELFGGYIDLDECRGRVPLRGVAEMEDPVEASTKDQDHVGFFESGAAGTGGVVRVGIGHDTLAHGGWKEREFAFYDEVANGTLGLRICCSFADDDEGGFGRLEESYDLRKLTVVDATSWCVRYWLCDLNL